MSLADLNKGMLFAIPAIFTGGIYQSIAFKENQLNQTTSESIIQKKMQLFLKQEGIRNDLKFKEKVALRFGEAHGINSFNYGDASINISNNLHKTDPNAATFILKREIGHIKANDLFMQSLVGLVGYVASMALFSFPQTYSFIGSTSRFVDIVSCSACLPCIGYKYYREGQADDFAILKSSTEELKGGRRIYKAMQQIYLDARQKTLWKKLFISSTGDNYLDLTYPSFESRIEKIEKTLKQRNATLNDKEEQKKIEQVKVVFLDGKEKFIKDIKAQFQF